MIRRQKRLTRPLMYWVTPESGRPQSLAGGHVWRFFPLAPDKDKITRLVKICVQVRLPSRQLQFATRLGPQRLFIQWDNAGDVRYRCEAKSQIYLWPVQPYVCSPRHVPSHIPFSPSDRRFFALGSAVALRSAVTHDHRAWVS